MKIVKDFDIVVLDHNLSTTKYILNNSGKPVLHPHFLRADTGSLAYNKATGRIEPEVINIPDGFILVKSLDYATKKL